MLDQPCKNPDCRFIGKDGCNCRRCDAVRGNRFCNPSCEAAYHETKAMFLEHETRRLSHG
jgi:hypothetical protein